MKKYLLILFVTLSTTLWAQLPQAGGFTISGTVTDSVAKAPVGYASVSISKTGTDTPINGAVTDDLGNFTITGIPAGNYTLAVFFIGYKTKTFQQEITANTILNPILLAPEASLLKEVVVTGTTALVSNKIDKLVYNVEKDITATGGTATDVLRKVPLVNVDIDGNVSIRGDSNVRVLINGKPSGATSNNLSDVLKTIPADQIKNIEVVTSPSAKYDAEGSAGIINIITKQKSTSGISGSVSGGAGTRQNNFNGNINYNKGKFSLAANVGYNNGWPQTSRYTSSQTFNEADNQSQQSTVGSSRVTRDGVIASLTAGYEIDTLNSIGSTFRLNQGGFESRGSGQSTFTDYLDATNSTAYTSGTQSKNSFGGFDWNLDYTHKFKKTGHEFVFSSQWSHSKNETDYQNTYTAFYTNQKADNDGKNDEYTLQLDYTLPVTEKFKLEAGGKTIFRRISSNFQNYVPDAQNNFIFDPINSNLYKYDQDVAAGYAVGTLTIGKGYTVMAGARAEHTAINGDPTNALQADLQPFSIDYTTFIPSFTLQKAFSPTSSLKLTYSKRITRPSLTYLNPFINRSNIQAQTQGNPSLDPEVSHTVELGYSVFVKKAIVNVSTYYKYTSGLIEGIATPLDGQTGTITTYQNIGNNKSLGMSFFGSLNPLDILTIRANLNGYTYNPSALGAYSTAQTQMGTYFQYSAFLSGTLTLKNGLSAEAFAIQNSSKRTLQGISPAFNLMVFGVKKQFWNKTASLGLNFTSPFKRDLTFKQRSSGTGFAQNTTFNYPIRSFGLTFSYSFGKMSFANPTQKKGVNNDDLKQGDTNNQGGFPAQ